ncbi:amino acid permease [Ilyonectria sp. MPI-CAGE-AT-0026]|nr:amino acid permease [Ilyonectria sp. MPI-CAGE-AT-0026]
MTKEPGHQTHGHAVHFSDDAAGLAAIGKTQAFDRRYNLWSVVGIGICVSSTWSAVSSAILPTLVSGGAVTLVWGFVFVSLGMFLVTASLAELASIWPSSGGQYHWVAELSNDTWRPVLSWLTGWLSIGSMTLGVVGSTFATAIQIQVFAMANNLSYLPKQWHVTMIFMALILLNALINIFGVRFYHALNIYAIIHQAVFFIVLIITILACKAPNFNSASYVFTNFENISGWSSDGISFFIGILGLVTGFIGVEAPAHFSEEMNHATRDVPRAMMYSVIGNALATFPWVIVLLFSMGSIEELVATKFGSIMPIFQIVLGATENVKASTFLNLGISVIAFLSALDMNGACARTLWSMARDNALPKIFRKVDEEWDVPIWPVVLISCISAALGCIYIGNVTAFYGIISGILVLQMTAYSIPIVLHLMQRGKVPYGPWKMPHVVGYAVNIGALCWCILGVVFFTFPIYQPVTAQNMNYSSVIFGFVLLLSAAVYLTYGKGRYIGPIREINGIPDLDNTTRENSMVGDTEMGEHKD